ncbi:hypothetical protein AAH979_17645 [Plantactinospora sp. ZYX-F-223]|uniref:hypothetical protein n=1 Tax=Plantactinospora sp. ZYX-F-223 TaxID=3144103 RepID=UPI0031FDB98D
MTDSSMPSTPGISWQRRSDGLYLPDSHDRPPAVGGPPLKERHKVTDWLQGIGTMIAAVIAALALLVGAQTLQDQQQINRDQLAFNQETRDRAKRRYISRVTWWLERNNDSAVIYVQNRAPVPLLDVELETQMLILYPPSTGIIYRMTDDPSMFLTAPDIPPCSTVALTAIQPSDLQVPAEPPSDGTARIPYPVALWISEHQNGWRIPQGGRAEPADRPYEPWEFMDFEGWSTGWYTREHSGALVEERETRQELSDCGEGD